MEPIEFAGYALVFMIFMLPFAVLYAKKEEAKEFNGGYCKHCYTKLEHFDTDHQYGRGYHCPNCDHIVWVSYPTIDNFKN